jgi:MFS family permease
MAQFAVVVDFSIVQIALPTIRAELAMSLGDLQWIVSAYGLTFAGLLLLSGRLSDIYGRKRLFLVGLLIFWISSLAAGLATSEQVLIAARVVQGVGAAMASATCLALIVRIFGPLGRLNQALGIFTAVSSAGFSAGLVLGGVLTEALGWRWIFFVNVPIGIVATLLSARYLPDPAGDRSSGRNLDVPGALSVTGGLMLLVYGLSEVGNGDTSAGTYLVFLLSVVALAEFIGIEHRSAAPPDAAALPPAQDGLLRQRDRPPDVRDIDLDDLPVDRVSPSAPVVHASLRGPGTHSGSPHLLPPRRVRRAQAGQALRRAAGARRRHGFARGGGPLVLQDLAHL